MSHFRLSYWGPDKGGAVDDPTPVWGPDAAAQSAAAGAGGAGGVGGLIMGALYADNFYDDESGVCYGYDANGDVMTLVNMGGNSGYYLAPNVPGSLAAYYMYDPFGGLALATGNFAYANPFRFSTKYAEGDFALFNGSIHTCSPDDLDPGLYYCISREYRTDIGRFMSRDPMDEAGGLNLYAACGNDLVNRVDALGLFEFQSTSANGVEISGGGWNGTITKSGGYVTWAVPNIQSSPFFELHGYGGGFSISGSGSMSFTPNSMSASQCSETEAPFAINNIGWGAQFSPPGVWVSAGDVCGISSGTSKLTYTLQGPVAVLTASNESQLSSNLFVSPLCTCFNAKGSINVEITIYQSAAGVAGAAAGAAAALVADVPAFVEWLLQNGEDVEETGSGGSPQPAPP